MRSSYITELFTLNTYLFFDSESTVKRRQELLQLQGSHAMGTAVELSHAEQLVVNQLDNDLAKGKGVEAIWYQVAYDEGIHLTKCTAL